MQRTHDNDGELAYAKTLLEEHGYVVVHNQELRSFGPIKRAIFDLVRKRNGVTAVQIFDNVWGSDPDHAPQNLNTVRTHIAQMNKKLATWGMKIKSSGGWHTTYHLVHLE
jgi:hypothetical protein